MRRKTFVLGFAASVAALVAIVYGIGSHPTASTIGAIEPRREGANQVQRALSADEEIYQSTEVVPMPSLDGYQDPAVTENDGWDTTGLADEESSGNMVRESATREIPEWYSLLLERLNLTPKEKEALLSFLIDTRIASTWTPYHRGKAMDDHERSNRIAAIIGETKAQQFLALERNIGSYIEVQNVGSMLQQKGVPLADTQRDDLLKILIEIRSQVNTAPAADIKRGYIASFEYRLSQIDEQKRLVLELAPSVLSPEQVQHLFERYQALSYEWAAALEVQRKQLAGNPNEKRLLWYPPENY